MQSVQFFGSRGDRQNAPNIAIFITGGVSRDDANLVSRYIQEAHRSEIHTIAVGFGNIHANELRDLASEPSDDYYFYTHSPSSLTSALGGLVQTVRCVVPAPGKSMSCKLS